jgi:hypothetical protein
MLFIIITCTVAVSIPLVVWVGRRALGTPRNSAVGVQQTGSRAAGRVLWDASDRAQDAMIKGGRLYLRRHALVPALTAVLSFLAISPPWKPASTIDDGATADGQQAGGASTFAVTSDHVDSYGKHIDMTADGRHADGTPHNDHN